MKCPYCTHFCEMAEGEIGFCRARVNRKGKSEPLMEGAVTSLSLDPIEKKPLYHFHPGATILSVGGFGCNFRCFFCQNADISMANGNEAVTEIIPPERLVQMALDLKAKKNIGVAFTYNEPMITFEYIRKTGLMNRAQGLKTVVVTNGCFTPAALDPVKELVDAWNIDLKGFTKEWYRRLGGDLEMVKRFIVSAHEKAHVEITTLVVPGENDGEQEIRDLSSWIAGVSPDIPLHLSRFFPRYHAADKFATEREKILRLTEVAREKLKYVHAGNM
ncbi:MAG: AmmeMemoRadiSam system radical SAM enzyme [Eubacteriales bacterium]|nr:AmmeMemoRadiSam system radical SAM enzyme [Eubacteriales bacterium]